VSNARQCAMHASGRQGLSTRYQQRTTAYVATQEERESQRGAGAQFRLHWARPCAAGIPSSRRRRAARVARIASRGEESMPLDLRRGNRIVWAGTRYRHYRLRAARTKQRPTGPDCTVNRYRPKIDEPNSTIEVNLGLLPRRWP
jgi:hypothetical protein